MIMDHEAYKSTSKNPQTDVRLQMAIVLEKLGSNGNGVSHGKLARRSGVASKSQK